MSEQGPTRQTLDRARLEDGTGAAPPWLILKTGETLRDGVTRDGDFEDWILAGMGVARDRAVVVDVRQQDPMVVCPSTVVGVVVTGSVSMVTDRHAWSERCAAWLRTAIAASTPVLGICYGHQLLAAAMGGAVVKNPRGREIGTVTVRLHPAAKADPLFGELAAAHTALKVHASHLESVVSLPAEATPLAESDGDAHQAFAVGTLAWGVQFHPEFDAATLRAYATARREAMHREGLDVAAVLASIHDTGFGGALLRRFRLLAEEHGWRSLSIGPR